MCKYCENEECIINADTPLDEVDKDEAIRKYHWRFDRVFIKNNELVVKNINHPEKTITSKVKIKYCPICGRKLME